MFNLRHVSIGIVATMLPKTTALGDPFGTCSSSTDPDCEDTGALAPDRVQSYCRGTISWESGIPSDPCKYWDDAKEMMTVLQNTTDMAYSIQSNCTDANITFDEESIPGARGYWTCDVWSGTANTCLEGRVVIANLCLFPSYNGATDRNVDKTLLHEIGHSVGLTHYKDGDGDFPNAPGGVHDCMISGNVDNNPIWETFNPHHTTHINNQY